MKLKHTSSLVFTAMLAIAGAVGCASEKKEHANLAAQAKISRADAEQAALAKVPGGNIKEGELEKEKGRLIWSFDIATPGTRDISEVAVDAISGVVLSVDKETPKEQAEEAAEDAGKPLKKD